jgi:hypothetical protein
MASTVKKTSHDGSVKLKDGSGTPVTLTVPSSIGDTSLQGLRAIDTITGEMNEDVVIVTRGRFDGLRSGDRVFPSGTLTARMTEFTNASAGNLADFVLFSGAYSANVSTLGANASRKTLDLEITVEGTSHGDGADHVILLEDCVISLDWVEGELDMYTLSYICYGAVTRTGPS